MENRNAKLLFAGLSLMYLALVYLLASDIPVMDDYDAFLEINLQWLNRDASGDSFWRILWAQHNEHRIVFSKIISWLQLQVFGEINFRWLIVLGNVCLIPAIYITLFGEQKPIAKRDLFWLMPLFFLAIMHPQHTDNTLWATGALQNYGVICWSFISLLLLQRKSSLALGMAIVMGVLATLTSLSGLVVWPVGLFVLFQQRRKPVPMVFWMLPALLLIILYSIGYHRPPLNPDVVSTIRQRPGQLLLFIPALAGGIFREVLQQAWMAAGAGMLGLIGGTYLMLTSPAFRRSWIFHALLLVLASMMMTALGRSWWGWEYAFSSRYRILPTLFWLLLVMGFYRYKSTRGAMALGLAALLILAVGTAVRPAYYWKMVKDYRSNAHRSITCFQQAGRGNYLLHPDRIHAVDVLTRSEKAGIYFYQKLRLTGESDCELAPGEAPVYALELYMALDHYQADADSLRIEGWAFTAGQPFFTERDSLLLQNIETGRVLIVGFRRRMRPDVAAHFSDPLKTLCGFGASVAKNALDDKPYLLGFRVADASGQYRDYYSAEIIRTSEP